MINEPRIEKTTVFKHLDEIYARGEPLPGARALRAHFKTGSFSTYNEILNQWKLSQENQRQAQLDTLSIHSEDLEGKLIQVLLPILNGRVREIVKEALAEAEVPMAMEKQQNKDLLAELQEVNKENQALKEELEKASQERERISTSIADRVEAMAQKHALEIQQLRDRYEAEIRTKDEINRKLDEVLMKVNNSQTEQSAEPAKRNSSKLKTDKT
ncbi:MAG: DNA-binding protein [Parabacteroides sp.]|nr:DNA-binding protein [Parabacteroides sp.]